MAKIDRFIQAIAEVESGNNPDAISPKGAMGRMQVMPATARKPGYGIKPAKNFSDRELTRVGRQYAVAMLDRFGNEKDALVAYNWGPGNARKWIKEGRPQGKLPKETRNYVKKVTSLSGKTSPLVEALTETEIRKRAKKSKSVRDKGDIKMATPAQIRRLEKEIQMDKKLGMSKKLLARKQARLNKMKGIKKAPSKTVRGDPETKLLKKSPTAKRKKPSSVVSQAKQLLKKEKPSSKVVSKVVRDAMAKDKAKKATAKKTAAIASQLDVPGSGKTRAARKITESVRKTPKFINKKDAERTGVGTISFPKPKDPLAVDIQGKGSKPTSKVREQQKAEKIKADTIAARKRYLAKQRAAADAKKARTRASEFADTKVIKPAATSRSDSYRGARRGPDTTTGGLPLKDAMHIGTRVKRGKRKPISQMSADLHADAPKRTGVGTVSFPKPIKKPKTTSADLHADAPKRTGVGTVSFPKPIKKPKTTSADLHADAPKPGMGFDAALAARKAGPKKKKVTEKRIADDVEGYDPMTGQPSGEDAPKEFSFKDLFGSLDITRADDEPEYDVGHKHGGKVSKGMKKTKRASKIRKRAALRGHRAELRGG